jgi:hypothetical protein
MTGRLQITRERLVHRVPEHFYFVSRVQIMTMASPGRSHPAIVSIKIDGKEIELS